MHSEADLQLPLNLKLSIEGLRAELLDSENARSLESVHSLHAKLCVQAWCATCRAETSSCCSFFLSEAAPTPTFMTIAVRWRME